MNPGMEKIWVRSTGDGNKKGVINRCYTIDTRIRLRTWIWRREIRGEDQVLTSEFLLQDWPVGFQAVSIDVWGKDKAIQQGEGY